MSNIQTANRYLPDYLVTPGEVLEEYLEFSGLTQASLADRTGLSNKTINEIVKAKSTITAETALKFERTLGRPAHFWSNLERQYQEDKTRLADKKHLLQYRILIREDRFMLKRTRGIKDDHGSIKKRITRHD